MNREIHYLGELQRVERRPGDLFVLHVDEPVSLEQSDKIRAEWKARVGDEQLLIVTRGYRLGVLGAAPSAALTDVVAERRRQVEREGWTTEHDDMHTAGELAAAASRYATNAAACMGILPPCLDFGANWPWHESWFKPTTPRRDLVKAAALLLAEIERIDRTPTEAGEGSAP